MLKYLFIFQIIQIVSLPQIVSQSTNNNAHEIYNRDPKSHRVGSTFLEVTNLFQGYFMNEIDLNDTQSCAVECRHYKDVEPRNCKNRETMKVCKAQKQCTGRLRYCKFIHSEFTMCISEGEKNRKLDFVQFGNDRLFGKQKSCDDESTFGKSWGSSSLKCDYCFCVCENEPNPNSDRYFNLRPRFADVTENK